VVAALHNLEEKTVATPRVQGTHEEKRMAPKPRDALAQPPDGPHVGAVAETVFRDEEVGTTNDSSKPRPISSGKNTFVEPKKGKKDKKEDGAAPPPMATYSQLFSFLSTPSDRILFAVGCFFGFMNGLTYPALAYIFSNSFSSLGGASSQGMDQIETLAFQFLAIGAYAFFCATVQSSCLEVAASRAARRFRTMWFEALLRQDAAFFDLNDVSGLSSLIGPNASKVRRGLGRKFGEGVQFFTTFVAGLAYAFWSSWRVAILVLAVLPFVAVTGFGVMKINQSQTARAAEAYSRAGSVAYSTVGSIKTVLSLNAAGEMIRQYSEATMDAYRNAVSPLVKQGLVNGFMLGSFIVLYCILTLYGSYLLYEDVRGTGCDPSDAVPGVDPCGETGPSVFGAMLGAAFAGQGISQVANVIEAFTAARTACYPATVAIERVAGTEAEEVVVTAPPPKKRRERLGRASQHRKMSRMSFKKGAGSSGEDEEDSSSASESDAEEGGGKVVKAVLPPYVIDSSSPDGEKPKNVQGAVSFRSVGFSYPTRPGKAVFNDFNLEIDPGTTVALVGPSGGGKSTVVSLLERFYDPNFGSVSLDGTDLRSINVRHLRSMIGYVGQEPALFATTIERNIKYGCPNATREEVERAARLANAHEFISGFPDGYNTQVGDKGAQLSGGQKQRIAIARVLVSNPKLLILDEATSALDSESELVVQEALDKLLSEQKRTTIVIAHRLSTIRNADVIAVIQNGNVAEKGSHDELMASPTGHYRNLVEKQSVKGKRVSRAASEVDSAALSTRDSFVDVELADGGTCRSQIAVHQLKFVDCTFAYPTRPSKKIFDGFSLSIRRGETLALVGPSGGGKSTTVSLIERFYDPQEGLIQFEGVDLKNLSVPWLRDQIGFVQQEPTLFNATIARNIAYGFPGASEEQIREAAKMANAHDFIMSFPDGYETEVGERGTQISGGQKQRIAIARALVKNPRILLLDEATSALDTDSERVVQDALDKLMEDRGRTTIVIAHRLSTIRNADRIAYVADGKVREIGTHDELMDRPKGRYCRLVDSQSHGSTVLDLQSIKSNAEGCKKGDDDEEDDDEEVNITKEREEEENSAYDAKKARQMAKPDLFYLFVGGVGTIFAGGVFPAWGIMFGLMIKLLFQPVLPCSFPEGIPLGFSTCEEYQDYVADDMRENSFRLSYYWLAVATSCIVGNTLLFWGFGNASERMNKRVRDSAFGSLVRQEVAFFDKRSIGDITTQLQDDAAKLHTFTGEPIRTFLLNLSSVLTGLVISFIFMWPFALVSIATIPFMGFATSIEMKVMLGGDEEKEESADGLDSPGGIIVETLLNIRTVSALCMEGQRYRDYVNAVRKAEPRYVLAAFKSGVTSGVSMLIQQWTSALQFWWGGWLLYNYSDVFTFEDFLISMFALMFSLFSLGASAQGLSDRKECEKSAGRIFYLMDRQSAIDPLEEEGIKLD